jgi:hypothetical protein
MISAKIYYPESTGAKREKKMRELEGIPTRPKYEAAVTVAGGPQ